jgi:hypothetical protein
MAYVNYHDLYFETVLSKGKGKITDKLNNYFYLIANGVTEKLRNRSPQHIHHDQLSEAYLALAERWGTVNIEKTNNVLPFYSEICKRSAAQTYNMIIKNVRLNGAADPSIYSFSTSSLTEMFNY